jgi:hypothetical protein
LKKIPSQKMAGGVTKGVGCVFKPQFHKKTPNKQKVRTYQKEAQLLEKL